MPTAQERRDHDKHHHPFRSLVQPLSPRQGQGGPASETAGIADSPGVLRGLHMFMWDESVSENMAVLVIKERNSKMLAATVVLRKSTGESAGMDMMARDHTRDARGSGGDFPVWRLVSWSCGKRRPVAGAVAKLTCLWEEGVVLGVKATYGEYMVGSHKDVVKVRTMAKRAAEGRLAPKVLDMIGGVLWRLSEDDPEMDGEPLKMQVSREAAFSMSAEDEVRRGAPRRMYIKL